jgi:coenzyme F420 hydrogenase subunit beta
MPFRIKSLPDVVDWGLCIGCGACYSACARGAVALVNIEAVGIRPKFDEPVCTSCGTCLSFCPGYSVDGNLEIGYLPKMTHADHEFGPALEVWEGYAADPEIRYRASSGGLLTALSLYCLEREAMAFALHAGMDETKPWTNRTVQSRSRGDLLSRAGSRYAPASPCDGLNAIEQSERPCVFIGKPCDAAAVSKLRRERPLLDRNLGLVLTFFCAGTPSTQGTLDLLKSLDISPDDVDAVHYRGEGWPGRFRALGKSGKQERSFAYMESWGRLAKYRPFRCHICPDGLGFVADLACGDAWEQFEENGDPGRSIVLVRTERGHELLHRAIAAGYVELKPVTSAAVLAAQKNLLQRRREIFGRLLAMRLLLVPTPKFRGFSLLRSWMREPLSVQVLSFLGTLRRLVLRGLWRRRPLFPSGNRFQ